MLSPIFYTQPTILYCDSSRSSAGGFCDLMYRVKNTFLPARLVASACEVSEGVQRERYTEHITFFSWKICIRNLYFITKTTSIIEGAGETSCRSTVVTCFVFFLMRTRRRGLPRFNKVTAILCSASFPNPTPCVLARSYPTRRVNILLSLRSRRT